MSSFPSTDSELFEHIRRRANVRPAIPWERIAEELGVKVPDLLDWFVAYREPKRDRSALVKARGRSPMLLASNPGGGADHIGADAQRFANWRRARDGAAKARPAQ